jgi:hypothetical protein
VKALDSLGMLYFNKGILCWSSGEHSEIENNMLRSLEIYKKVGNLGQIGAINNMLGVFYKNNGSFEPGISFLRKGLKIFEKQEKRSLH